MAAFRLAQEMMNTYNNLVERCFNECITSFRTKAFATSVRIHGNNRDANAKVSLDWMRPWSRQFYVLGIILFIVAGPGRF